MNKKRITFLVLLGSLTILGLILIFSPYVIIPDIETITHVAWTEPYYETPKAAVTLTFTSKIAFTTNFPIHAKVKMQYFIEGENDTNVFVLIVNPPAQAFNYPLDETPYSGKIKVLKENDVGEGELDLEFTSAGSYGFLIITGSSDYLGNMTVAHAGQDEEVIAISPPETRFQTEMVIRSVGVSLIPLSVILTFLTISDKTRTKPLFILQRFKVIVEKPVKSNWSIRILHPNEPIERCIILYDGKKLPWWDEDTPHYEKTIEASSGGIVRVPVTIQRENAEIKVLDGKRILRKNKFNEITLTKR